jgi:hypothetical protein
LEIVIRCRAAVGFMEKRLRCTNNHTCPRRRRWNTRRRRHRRHGHDARRGNGRHAHPATDGRNGATFARAGSAGRSRVAVASDFHKADGVIAVTATHHCGRILSPEFATFVSVDAVVGTGSWNRRARREAGKRSPRRIHCTAIATRTVMIRIGVLFVVSIDRAQ